jgi:hypothetical protein
MTNDKPVHPDETAFGKIHAKRQAAKKVRVIKVPEWGTKRKPLLLFAYPLTVNDVIALDNVYHSNAEQNVMQIIRQCLDSKGDPYFTLIDKPALQNEPSDIIGRILVALNGENSTFTEELKKNKQ